MAAQRREDKRRRRGPTPYVQEEETRRAGEWDRAQELQIEIDKATAEQEEIHRRSTLT